MKIKTISIINFAGLKGKRCYDFPSMIALCAENGAGKTSFINALRFVLTGQLPEGDIITEGEAFAAVQIETESGHKYMRQKFSKKDKAVKCAYDDKTCSATVLNKYLENETGVPISTAKLAVSGELLTSLSNQQLGELLLKYLPEQLSTKLIASKIDGLTKEQEKILEEVFEKIVPAGEEEFSTSKIDEAYNVLVDRRKVLKQTLAKKKAVYDEYAGAEVPEQSMEEIQSEIDAAMKRRDAAIVYETQKKAYDAAVQKRRVSEKRIQELEKEIASINVPSVSDGDINKIADDKTKLYEKVKALDSKMEAEKTSGHQLLVAVKAFKENSGSCPFAKGKLGLDISCTTDMSSYVADFVKELKNLKTNYEKSADMRQKLTKQLEDADDRLKEAYQNKEKAYKKESLKRELEGVIAALPEIPNEPEKTEEFSKIDAKLKALNSKKTLVMNKEKIKELGESIRKYENLLSDYEFLVLQLSPKGDVKQSITSYYLKTFTDSINEKAQKLLPKMKLGFVTDNGVSVLTDVHGDGAYLEYNQLSGGEKAYVMFLLLDLLSSLSGLGMMIIDELSVLDKEAFSRLLELLISHKGEYDHILLSAVNSTDYEKALKKNKVEIFNL